MKWICVIAILLCFTSVKTNLSILTDEKNKTLSSVETIKSESYELTLLRLMINQETTLRLNLVKHVHELISDVSLIKQSFRASETTIEGLKQTIVSLQRENMQLNNSSNARISELETKLQRVNEYINSVGEQKKSITGLQQTIETFTIQVNSLQEENGEIKNRSINNHARLMELKTKLRTVKEDVNMQVNSLQLERSGFRNGIINNHAMIMELKTRLQTVNESVSSLHEHVDVIQRESNRELFNRTNGVLGDIRVEIRNLSRTFSDFRKHREAENELMENLENHFNSSLGNSTYANSPTSKKFNSLEAHFSDNLYRTFAHFETNLKTLKNEQVKLSSAVDSLENVHVNNCKNWTFGLSCDECACVQLHSEFCDKINGQCHCKQGYTGDACQCKDNGGPCQHHIRLVNADNITSMGRVEVVTNGVWSTVCDEDWDHDDATVVCKQLGLGMNGIGVSHAPFGKGIGPNFISKVDCKGNETDVFNCSFVKLSCSHANDAGVICVNKSDSIRLVNGSFATNGRLEVRLEGRGPWATVCDDGFTKNDARVACRELGLPTRHVEVKASAFYGRGSGFILVNHLRCTGNESSLQLCPKQNHPVHCVHSEDVGVSCFNDCPSFTYGVECEKTCTCDQNKSLSCDKDTGECLCKDGWAGVRCTCRNKSDCDENSYCDGTSCVCNDGFLTKTSNCSGEVFVSYSCSFETDLKTCSITNYGKMKWKRHSRGTPSDNTGPYSAKEGTFYVYTEASGGSKGDEGVMEISLTNLNLTTYACFQFYYHMRGEDMGELDVIIEDKSGSEVGRWSRSGNVNSDWNQGFISLPANAEMVKVTGRRGSSFTSDIALDDLKLFHCLMPDHVAFHAVAYSPTSNAVVIFDHVITNVGGGYDNTTGVFTVPTPGLYVFSWTIETYGQRTEAVLLVNDVQQALSRADQASSYYDTTTSFAVLNLTLNDKININVTMGSAQAMHTMFSGWKINKTDDTAFSASLSREVNGSTIVFNNETLDTDSAYSTSTGRFVAPRSGLYVFMMSATTDGSSDFYTKFVFSNGNSQQKAGSWLLIQMQLNQITQYF
nr:uncharacterized protein LOC109620900 isoform X2 [Crassostrea gigas]